MFIPDLQVYIAAVFVQFVDIDGALVHEITQVTLLDQVRFVEVAVQADELLRKRASSRRAREMTFVWRK